MTTPPQQHGTPEDLEIRDGMIRLGQALKLANLAEDGAHARSLVEEGRVRVNGEVETRRGRQLHAGDVVSAHGTSVRITARD
ncbi:MULTISPECIES: RNA-binding S4 domain-containing protein [Kocuria]|jgi:ribosome-associated protein|uniref:RNA-binding S4 domain-containing protein n=1 Tax=Kocuria TaxID=57493 RepID=UPI00203B6C00|nr:MULTISPECIES: RNA-binding S4 domain-containing protein [Kocuria]MCM3687913.1 RNA-binding S4 domain-containing protein [Kocuria rosea]HST71555.1 RNA-binding S4 domain-containing protein [Kocuria rosea]